MAQVVLLVMTAGPLLALQLHCTPTGAAGSVRGVLRSAFADADHDGSGFAVQTGLHCNMRSAALQENVQQLAWLGWSRRSQLDTTVAGTGHCVGDAGQPVLSL